MTPQVCRDFDVLIPRCSVVSAPTETKSTGEFLKKALGVPKLEYLSHPESLDFKGWPGCHATTSPFFQALHQCFARHYPLALSPEVLMYMVLHEIAITVKANPNHYRHLFTTTAEGKQTIEVEHDFLELGNPASPWHETLPMFEKEMGKLVPSKVLAEALPDFSTHTAISRAASMVAFMDMASPYYDYRVMTMCGIPKIRLLGTPEDYNKLFVSCVQLSLMFDDHLGLYFKHLIPVLKTIMQQAAGAEYDNNFWSSIYNPTSGSGTDGITGWATAFLNYEKTEKGFVAKSKRLYDWEKGSWNLSYDRGSLPCHVSKVDFVWKYYGKEIPMDFLGGIITIENQDGYVTPAMGFAVAHKVR